MKNMIALRSSIVSFLIFLSIGCKETCYSCSTTCNVFEELPLSYCLSDFDSEIEYNKAVDSLKNIYTFEYSFRQVSSFCESEGDITSYINNFGWNCIEQ